MQKKVRKPKAQKPKLPPYVTVKKDTGAWYVRRAFPTSFRQTNGNILYTQIVRRCDPQTPERAREISDEIQRQFTENAPPPIAEQTVDGFVSAFVAAKKGSVAIRTHDSYEWYFEKYVEGSAFGRMTAESITPLEVQSFYSSLTAKGVSGTMIRKLHNFLSMAFNQGVRWELVRRNPCRGVILPRANDTEIEILDIRAARAFSEVCFNDPDLLVLAFALETGMRPGEYLALQWKNVDLDKLTVKVVRSVSFPKAGGFYYKDPKTKKSKRPVDISEKLAAALRELLPERAELVKSLNKIIAEPLVSSRGRTEGVNYNKRKMRRKLARERLLALIEHDLVFPGKSGTPISPHNLGIRNMTEACTKAGLPHHSIYSLRHTSATVALASGVDIKTVSEKLGHADIKITLDFYAHVLPIMKSKGVKLLAEALY